MMSSVTEKLSSVASTVTAHLPFDMSKDTPKQQYKPDWSGMSNNGLPPGMSVALLVELHTHLPTQAPLRALACTSLLCWSPPRITLPVALRVLGLICPSAALLAPRPSRPSARPLPLTLHLPLARLPAKAALQRPRQLPPTSLGAFLYVLTRVRLSAYRRCPATTRLASWRRPLRPLVSVTCRPVTSSTHL